MQERGDSSTYSRSKIADNHTIQPFYLSIPFSARDRFERYTIFIIETKTQRQKQQTHRKMSERMIELQRARLLAAGKGSRNHAAAAANGSAAAAAGASSAASAASASTPTVRQTPQQAAAAAMLTEDQLLDRFIQRLHHRDDSRADAASASTVPTALSRRILNKQGVGYLDGTVAAVVSAAADRFLATVLQQTMACRNERLKGAELLRGAERTRQRHWEQYEADVEYRRKRKLEIQEKQTQICHNAIKAAESLKKFPPANSASATAAEAETTPSKKKKKKSDDTSASGAAGANGSRLKLPKDGEDDDEASVNSLDEEEAYHRDYFGDVASSGKRNNDNDEDDDDEDDMVILRDLARPLEAWDFHVTGKYGMLPAIDRTVDSEDESDEEEDDEADAGAADSDEDDAGDDDDADELDGKMTPVPKASDKKKSSPSAASDSKRRASTPAVPTPTPTEASSKD